jgi:hypothetical protein
VGSTFPAVFYGLKDIKNRELPNLPKVSFAGIIKAGKN